jgi:hypothetical protein
LDEIDKQLNGPNYRIKLLLRHNSKKDANLIDELLGRENNDINLLKCKSISEFKDVRAGRKISKMSSAYEQQIWRGTTFLSVDHF